MERRYVAGPVEVPIPRPGSGAATIRGYAAKFNTSSKNLGGFTETIRAGFFTPSEAAGWPDVIARYNHDDNMLLGTTAAGTLRLAIDGTGLLYEVDTPQSRADVLELVQRGDVSRSSFAFSVLEDEWTVDPNAGVLRTLVTGTLHDVAPVNTPAYDDTSVEALRSLARKFDAPLEEVRALADRGELRRFFARTTTGATGTLSGAAALLRLSA